MRYNSRQVAFDVRYVRFLILGVQVQTFGPGIENPDYYLCLKEVMYSQIFVRLSICEQDCEKRFQEIFMKPHKELITVDDLLSGQTTQVKREIVTDRLSFMRMSPRFM